MALAGPHRGQCEIGEDFVQGIPQKNLERHTVVAGKALLRTKTRLLWVDKAVIGTPETLATDWVSRRAKIEIGLDNTRRAAQLR